MQSRDSYLNLVLPGILARYGLSGRDAAFATELAAGTLRWRGLYDAVLARVVDRPLDRLDPAVLDLLRLGSHQALRMRVAAHAAVAATVELTRAVAGDGPSRLVNAVLRRVAARDQDGWAAEVAPAADTDPVGHLAVTTSHPAWVVREFALALRGHTLPGTGPAPADTRPSPTGTGGPAEGSAPAGEGSAAAAAVAAAGDELRALLAADNEPAAVTLVALPGQADVAELVAGGATPGRFSPYAAVLPGGDPRDVPAVRDGRARVQDEGSQLVAAAAATVPVEGRDARWLDLCAGPGGKTALLAALAGPRGARVLAAEWYATRAGLVRRAVHRFTGVDVVCADGRRPPWRPGSFDRVLVDVPCTGLGALRRRVEARWRRAPDDPARLARVQAALLDAALTAVRPGGVVAYTTCTPLLAETREVVERVRAGRDDVALVDARPYLPVGELGPGPAVQLWPHRHGTDAMYLALLRREPRPAD